MNKSALLTALLVLAAAVCHTARSQLNGPNRAQTIANIFQIPIQTLTAIGNVAQNTRPIGEIVQRRRRPQSSGAAPASGQSPPVYYGRDEYTSRAARVAGLRPAADGSFFRI